MKFHERYPRVELYALYVSFQGLAQSASAALTDPKATSGKVALAAMAFVFVSLGTIAYTSWFILVRLLKEKRARLSKDRHGFCQWVDTPPNGRRKKHYYSGFCARYGAMSVVILQRTFAD